MFDEFKRDFVPDSERRTLTFDVTSDDVRALERLAAENERERDDGLRYVLAAGLAYAQGQKELAALQAPEAGLAAEVRRLQAERMTVEARYAVMRFRAFTFMQAAQALEMKLNACRADLETLRRANEALRGRLEAQ